MNDKPFTSTHISDVLKRGRRTAVREHFGIEAFGVNAFTANAGEDVVTEHTEEAGGQEELYVVTSGRARFTIEGEETDAPAGTVVFVRWPLARRRAVATEDGTTALAVGGPRGEAYQVAPWEVTTQFWPLYEAKDYEGAREILARGVEQFPDNPTVLYNLACCESLLGRTDDALEHLRRALEQLPAMATYARSDSDFDPIRGDARFDELVSEFAAAAPERESRPDDAYAVAALQEVTAHPEREGRAWLRVRRHFDVGAFGVNAFRSGESGGQVIEDHTERAVRHQELYFVLDGHAKFTVAGEEIDAPAGTFVYIRDPESRRGAVAEEPGTTLLAVGGRPGQAYEVSPWEDFAEAVPYFDTKEYEKAHDVLERQLEKHPDHPMGLYNLACTESMLGRSDEAIGHLTRSIEREPRFRELAREDEDFAPLRDDPRFASAIAGESDADGAGP